MSKHKNELTNTHGQARGFPPMATKGIFMTNNQIIITIDDYRNKLKKIFDVNDINLTFDHDDIFNRDLRLKIDAGIIGSPLCVDTVINKVPRIKDVIFHNPATIIKWSDGSQDTIVKVDERYGDKFDPEHGLAMAICKKAMGNKGNFNEIFKKWVYENPRLILQEGNNNV